ncbi:hypothetical protein [Staphylococcus phage vB_SauH_DELF3]|nr:hypothetical protein [Staphylococcus phage vB_SauH_DELF3]
MAVAIQILTDKTEGFIVANLDTKEAIDIVDQLVRGEPHTDDVCELINFYSGWILIWRNHGHRFKLQDAPHIGLIVLSEEGVT